MISEVAVTYRKAGLSDIDVLVDFRQKQLLDEGQTAHGDISGLLTEYFTRCLTDGSLTQFIAMADGAPVATGGFNILLFPPDWENHDGKNALIVSIYTMPPYRKRGIASNILKLLVDEAQAQGCAEIRLQASAEGRVVYEKVGFVQSPEFMQIHREY